AQSREIVEALDGVAHATATRRPGREVDCKDLAAQYKFKSRTFAAGPIGKNVDGNGSGVIVIPVPFSRHQDFPRFRVEDFILVVQFDLTIMIKIREPDSKRLPV